MTTLYRQWFPRRPEGCYRKPRTLRQWCRGEVYGRFVARPRSWWRWVRQGRPTDEPVIVEVGRLSACPHGHGLVSGWCLDFARAERSIDIEALWERYSARFPVERVARLAGCGECMGGAA